MEEDPSSVQPSRKAEKAGLTTGEGCTVTSVQAQSGHDTEETHAPLLSCFCIFKNNPCCGEIAIPAKEQCITDYPAALTQNKEAAHQGRKSTRFASDQAKLFLFSLSEPVLLFLSREQFLPQAQHINRGTKNTMCWVPGVTAVTTRAVP